MRQRVQHADPVCGERLSAVNRDLRHPRRPAAAPLSPPASAAVCCPLRALTFHSYRASLSPYETRGAQYIAHLRTFLVLWLGCIPWVYVVHYGWFTVALCLVIGYGIIGIEEAAVEVENPFGR